MRCMVSAIAVALLAIATPALAQTDDSTVAPQRTVESAQRFLSEAISGQFYWDAAHGDSPLDLIIMTEARCVSSLTAMILEGEGSSVKRRLNWAKLSSVARTGNRIDLVFSDDGPDFTIRTSDARLAERAETALAYLKANCEVASDTGF